MIPNTNNNNVYLYSPIEQAYYFWTSEGWTMDIRRHKAAFFFNFAEKKRFTLETNSHRFVYFNVEKEEDTCNTTRKTQISDVCEDQFWSVSNADGSLSLKHINSSEVRILFA